VQVHVLGVHWQVPAIVGLEPTQVFLGRFDDVLQLQVK
jgi:hypothetical protein